MLLSDRADPLRQQDGDEGGAGPAGPGGGDVQVGGGAGGGAGQTCKMLQPSQPAVV